MRSGRCACIVLFVTVVIAELSGVDNQMVCDVHCSFIVSVCMTQLFRQPPRQLQGHRNASKYDLYVLADMFWLQGGWIEGKIAHAHIRRCFAFTYKRTRARGHVYVVRCNQQMSPLILDRCLKFVYEEIREVHKRRYLLQPIAIEVFSVDGRNFLLAFPKKVRNKVHAR